MTEQEAAALEALKTHARTVRDYHAVWDALVKEIGRRKAISDQRYLDAANAMDDSESALLDAAQPLIA